MRRARAVLTALGAAALLAPAAASAAVNVSLVDGALTIVGSAGDDTIVLGTAGSNALGPTTRVTGGAEDLEAGPGCQGFGDPNGPANADSIFCPTNDILRLQVDLLDGNDEFDTGGFDAVVNGGPGEDEITIGRSGGDGVNTIDGGPDRDTIDVGRAGEGDDIAGGPGLDTVDYASHSAISVTLDGLSNDGTGDEQDNVRPDVEHVIGTSGDDTLIGSDGPNTLDGAGGTDRLEGLGDADTLIGGLGTNDTTFGGAGNDTIMLRDGLRDACAVGGSGVNTVDVDLIDIQTIPGTNLGGTTRCLVPRNAPSPLLRDIIFGGAVDEGPNVRMTLPAPALRRAGVRARLACPAVLRRPCAGPLAVFTARGTRALGSIDYSVRPGRVAIVVVPLDSDARETALAAATLRIVSVEKGRSPLGPKTTVRFVAPRGS